MGVGIKVENLNAWYGKTQALYDIQHDDGGQPRHGADWAFGLRQIDVHPLLEPHA